MFGAASWFLLKPGNGGRITRCIVCGWLRRANKKGCPCGQPPGSLRWPGRSQPGPWTAYFADDPQDQNNDDGYNDKGKPHACLEDIADDFTATHGNHQQDEYQGKKCLDIFHSFRFKKSYSRPQ
jgi:hypothetical protein